MPKILYNSLTDFKNKTFPKENIEVGFVLKPDYHVEILNNNAKTELRDLQGLVDGYIEYVSYIKDENYDVLVDEEGILKGKKFNMLAYIITGYELYGDILILKKGILK